MTDLRSAGRGNSLAARDIASLVHPYTNLKAHEKEGPLVIARGKGIHIYDDSGKEYIEGLAGLWCTSLGFSEDRLIEAATKQMRQLSTYHIFASKSHEPGIELAERLLAMMPSPMARVFFANSGSEANDTVVKLVWYFNNALNRPKKKKIISRQRAYHGVTVASASLTGLPNNHRDFDLPIANIIHTDCPHAYNFANPGESEEAFATRLADSLEAMILREGPDTVAAFIAEPVMGAGGVLIPPKGYFQKIQAVLKKYDVLFVCDEVICGFGRTGSMWGAQTFGIQPDIMVMAKALSSAYLPISAVMVNEAVWKGMVTESEKIGTFGHGYTYSAHPVAAAVAIETLKIYEERDIIGHVRSVAPRFQAGFQKLASHPLVGEAQSVGLIGAVQLMHSKQPKQAFDAKQMVGAFMAKRAQEHGLICRALMGDRVALCPPLIVTGDQIDEIFRRFTRALDDTAAMAREKGLAAA
jgi:4-aminobutyrate--pyruvate transaminase